MFQQASRLQLRFSSPKGELTTEDLWLLPLTSATGKANLDDIAKGLFRALKSDENVSFVAPERKSDPRTQLAFDIVKHIIDVRVAENAAAAAAAAEAINKQGGAEYVQLKWIEKWNGALPTTQLAAGSATPLIHLPK